MKKFVASLIIVLALTACPSRYYYPIEPPSLNYQVKHGVVKGELFFVAKDKDGTILNYAYYKVNIDISLWTGGDYKKVTEMFMIIEGTKIELPLNPRRKRITIPMTYKVYNDKTFSFQIEIIFVAKIIDKKGGEVVLKKEFILKGKQPKLIK